MHQKIIAFMALLLFLSTGFVAADDWPHWMGPKFDGVWYEEGILDKFPKAGPTVKWRVPIGKGYTGPAVVDGKLYVMDRTEKPVEEDEDADPSAQRGLPRIEGTERVYCLDAETGKVIWQHEYESLYKISYPEGPRTTPVVDGDVVYTLGAMGQLICFDKDSGKILWQKDLLETYSAKAPVWGFSAHPRIFGNQLILVVGGEGSAVVSLDKRTGKEIWKSQTAREVGYAPPVPLVVNGKTQLVYWSDEAITGLDLEDGKEQWKVKFPEGAVQRPVVTIMTPQVVGRKVLVSNFYNGAILLEVAEDGLSAKKIWSASPDDQNHKTGLNILMGSPIIRNGFVYGFAGKGELRCLKVEDGKQVWEEKTAARAGRATYFATAFFTQNGDRYFIFNDQGELLIATLSPEGMKEISRAKIIEPISFVRGRNIVWSHPAYANKCMFVRNSKELICVDLAKR